MNGTKMSMYHFVKTFHLKGNYFQVLFSKYYNN